MISDAVLAAIVTGVGSVVTALITAVTTLRAERLKRDSPREDSGGKPVVVALIGYLVAAVIVLGAGGFVFYLVHDGTYSRLNAALPDIPNYKKRIYANIGLGFV